ncbi:MAG: sulfotransferase [Bacteroidota bacterium]
MLAAIKRAVPYDAKCQLLRHWRGLGNRFRKARYQKFLFLLCAPYSGSTLLHELLSTSPQVSANNIFGTREGQSLPEYRKLIDYRQRWEEGHNLPWEAIRQVWMQYWDISKPILLDKSPPNLMHTAAIQQHFSPAYFIAMTRNPYAHCESLHRRDQMSIEEAAKFSLRCLQYHRRNIEKCPNLLCFRYEDLMEEPDRVQQQIQDFLPQLGPLEMKRHFKAHNFKNKRLPLSNLNAEKIARLSIQQRQKINRIWGAHTDLLAYFDYPLLVD